MTSVIGRTRAGGRAGRCDRVGEGAVRGPRRRHPAADTPPGPVIGAGREKRGSRSSSTAASVACCAVAGAAEDDLQRRPCRCSRGRPHRHRRRGSAASARTSVGRGHFSTTPGEGSGSAAKPWRWTRLVEGHEPVVGGEVAHRAVDERVQQPLLRRVVRRAASTARRCRWTPSSATTAPAAGRALGAALPPCRTP